MRRIAVSAGVLALAASVPVSAQDKKTFEGQVKVVDASSREQQPPVMPRTERTTLSQGAPAGIEAPADAHDPWSGSFSVPGKKITVLLGKAEADATQPNALWIDLDGDGKLGEGERVDLEVSERETRGRKMAMGRKSDLELKAGGTTVPASFTFMRSGDDAPMAMLQLGSYLEATVDIGGAQRVVAVVDNDLDGVFGSANDTWTIAEAGARPTTEYAMLGMQERQFTNGHLVGIAVSDKTVQVSAVEASGPDPKTQAAQRQRAEHIWFARFDEERDDFIAQRELDTSRPKAETPIPWHYVSFDEGLKLAKEAGKPLFVDVMAFWCVWCYRLDYYTYPDKEVAELLTNDFVPVKIIQEQDAAGDYDKMMKMLDTRGIPAMGIFDAQGELQHKISGWSKPSEFVEELKKAKSTDK